MEIVPLEQIPTEEYETPKDNLMLLYATAKKLEFLCNSKNGMGIAASQVGLPWKLFIYWSNYPDSPKTFDCLIDCEYGPSDISKKSLSIEGCLSLGSKRFQLERYDSIVVKGKRLVVRESQPFLEELEKEFFGTIAVVLQHEIDHNFGRSKMIDSIGKRIYLS